MCTCMHNTLPNSPALSKRGRAARDRGGVLGSLMLIPGAGR